MIEVLGWVAAVVFTLALCALGHAYDSAEQKGDDRPAAEAVDDWLAWCTEWCRRATLQSRRFVENWWLLDLQFRTRLLLWVGRALARTSEAAVRRRERRRCRAS